MEMRTVKGRFFGHKNQKHAAKNGVTSIVKYMIVEHLNHEEGGNIHGFGCNSDG